MSEAERTQGTTGRLLAGRYRLGEVLGRGGMGTVWRAADETLDRTVAIKELRFSSSVDEDERHRLITRTLREAKAIARVRSNGAVTVFDVVDEDDRPWIVMELIEGSSLADVIREEGTLTPRRAAEVGLAVLDVLRAAHREGILHRDVKPSNVLIADDGRVVLTDFGIAQVEGDPSVTSTGMLVGAPSYISPERARGHRPGPPADLWSLGGLLYACVEGVPPYDKGSALATLTAVMTEPLEPPQHAGPLAEVIYGLLAKDPERRLDEPGARALLTDACDAPEDQGPQPPADATRTTPLPSPAAESAGREPPAGPAAPRRPADAADRVRGALRSARNAAAAAASPAPAAPARPSAPASRTGGLPRRTLVIVSVAAALAVLGAILAFALVGEENPGGSGTAGDARAASSGSRTDAADSAAEEPSASGQQQEAPPTGQRSAPATEPGTKEEGGEATAPPDGFAEVTDSRFHFTMALPEGWQRSGIAGQNSGGIYSESGGVPRVQVDFTATPGPDAVAAWRDQERSVRTSIPGYRSLGIEKVEYRGYPTVADWSFERDLNGQRVQVLNRGFRVDSSHGYAIMITCAKDAWPDKECERLRETAFTTFRPAD